MARNLGISTGAVSLYYSGKRGTQPHPKTLRKIARGFNEPESLWLVLGGFDGTLPS